MRIALVLRQRKVKPPTAAFKDVDHSKRQIGIEVCKQRLAYQWQNLVLVKILSWLRSFMICKAARSSLAHRHRFTSPTISNCCEDLDNAADLFHIGVSRNYSFTTSHMSHTRIAAVTGANKGIGKILDRPLLYLETLLTVDDITA